MRKAIALCTLVLALASFSFAQSGIGVQTSATAEAVVHYQPGSKVVGASAHWDDTVYMTWRHCQAYQSVHHKFLVFGKKLVTDTAACNADPSTVFAQQAPHNLVTNAGFDLISSAVSNTATQAAACNYVAVTNTAITPGAGDTTLSGEIASNGLTRAQGTYSHTNGTQTYTVSKVFTASGTQASQATGLFNASSSGTMCYEATYTQVTVNSGDTLTVTWTVTLS